MDTVLALARFGYAPGSRVPITLIEHVDGITSHHVVWADADAAGLVTVRCTVPAGTQVVWPDDAEGHRAPLVG